MRNFQQTKTSMDRLSRPFGEGRGQQRDPMNFGYFPPFGGNAPEFPPQSMPYNMFPFPNYAGSGIRPPNDDYNMRGGMIDNLIIQNQNE